MSHRQTDLTNLDFSVGRVSKWIFAVATGLIAIHLATLFSTYALDHDTLKGFVRQFDLDRERNIPTFVSSTMFLAAAVGFGLLHWMQRSVADLSRHWAFLAVLFALLAVDEANSWHELLIVPIRESFDLSGVLYYAWIVPYGIGVAAVACYLFPRILALPRPVRDLFLLSAAMYLAGAIGFEMVGGAIRDHLGSTTETLSYDLATASEESLELLGLALLLHAQLRLIADRTREVHFLIRP